MSAEAPFLEHDTLLRLPSVPVLKASAGSGKTFALTERYVQFLLSPLIPRNRLPNLLAITFSNNAAREMRESVLGWLKRLYFRDPARLAEIAAVTAGGEERAARRAHPRASKAQTAQRRPERSRSRRYLPPSQPAFPHRKIFRSGLGCRATIVPVRR